VAAKAGRMQMRCRQGSRLNRRGQRPKQDTATRRPREAALVRYLTNIRRPAAVLVGSADEQVVADQFAPLFQSLDVNIPVIVVPSMTHVDMIATPTALQAVGKVVATQG
jgi:hypothetical protein